MASTVKTDISDKEARNKLNIAIRSEPWYQDYFTQRGLDQNKVKLSKEQQQELQQLVVSKGFLDPSDGHVDAAGNVSDFHGWKGLPTAAKVAIIAGAAAGTAGAAGAFGGGGGLVSTGAVTPIAHSPLLAGGTLTAAGTAAPTVAGTTAAVGGGASTLLKVADATKKGLSTYDKVNSVLGAGSDAIAKATNAAGQNRFDTEDRNYRAAALNMQGEQQQIAADKDARANLYRASVAKNPQISEYNTRGIPAFSPEMMQGLSNFEKAALLQSAQAPERKPFVPYRPDLDKSTLESIGDYAAPAMSTVGTISKLLRK